MLDIVYVLKNFQFLKNSESLISVDKTVVSEKHRLIWRNTWSILKIAHVIDFVKKKKLNLSSLPGHSCESDSLETLSNLCTLCEVF